MDNFKEFLDYCESFYLPSHPDVLYPIDGLTREELALATLNYLDLCAASDGTISWGDGDSLDRERVRDILLEEYNYKYVPNQSQLSGTKYANMKWVNQYA